jgi:uncharacterized protein (TIGR02145 family)
MEKNQNTNFFWRNKFFLVLAALALVVIISFAIKIVLAASQTITDNFTDTTKIAQSSNVTIDTSAGTVTLSTGAWTCGQTLLDTRDNQLYPTTLIGSQCWMASGINVGTRINGTVTAGTDCSSAAAIQKYCMNNTPANCLSTGGLYTWNQAMCGGTTAGAQGICPTGWHVPTHDEWTTLERAVCTASAQNCATYFPYDSTTQWSQLAGGADVSLNVGGLSGFNADVGLPGVRNEGGSFNGVPPTFWTSLQAGNQAWYRQVQSGSIARFTQQKAISRMIRCLKD